ncbi:MAG: Holliday junction resolvase RuvX [Nitrospira sp.]
MGYAIHMRYLGIDYGAKRVGVALSDEAGDFAFPLVVLENTDQLVSEIISICRKQDVGVVVVGDSKDFSQKENEIMKEVTPFAKVLQDMLGVPVYMHPEFMTSIEAERLQGKNDMHDASAAAIILKSYLETIKNKQ